MRNWRGKAVVCASQPAVAGSEDGGGAQSKNNKRYEQALELVVGYEGKRLRYCDFSTRWIWSKKRYQPQLTREVDSPATATRVLGKKLK